MLMTYDSPLYVIMLHDINTKINCNPNPNPNLNSSCTVINKKTMMWCTLPLLNLVVITGHVMAHFVDQYVLYGISVFFFICRCTECLLGQSRVSASLSGLRVNAASVTCRPEILSFTVKSVRTLKFSVVT